ncbi:MAG: type II toxin-antitoxin system RelE/ParE family toxin [Candidatus Tectomicrobia bacterium]
MRIFWEEDAEEDLDRIFEYILEDNPEAALRVVETIQQTVQMLIEHPHLGRAGRVADTRELVIPGTPYIVPYQVLGDQIIILRALHGAQQWPESFEEQ